MFFSNVPTPFALLSSSPVVCFAKPMSCSQITNPSCFLRRELKNQISCAVQSCKHWGSVVSFPRRRVKGQRAIFEEMIEDEEGLVDDRLPTTSRGLWAASETERTLKAILSFAKAKRLDPELVEEGNTFMDLFETWKKEYKVRTGTHVRRTVPLMLALTTAVLLRCCTSTGWFYGITCRRSTSWGWPPRGFACVCPTSPNRNCCTSSNHMRSVTDAAVGS